MKISSIVAMGTNRVIGKDNRLMWKIPSETKHYKDILGDHSFIIGRKNYESTIDSIDHERALVLTRNNNFKAKAKVFNTIESAISEAKDRGETELFVLGGQEIYHLLMPFINCLYLTTVEFDLDGDAYFPCHQKYEWNTEEEFSHSTDEHTPIPWSFKKLTKRVNSNQT